ncbi:MAG: SPOR domain-containing protein [Gemmatimonadaceae bacterium]|nr:SPOR domain-containing protein [Gemmatimonadaceae bacterium]
MTYDVKMAHRHRMGSARSAVMLSAIAAAFTFGSVRMLHAQESTVSAAMDRQISRARALVESGEGAEARNLLDSLVNTAPAASFDIAEALYWRAVLAERMSDAERDWKRLVIEAPLSPRTADALVRLGELDLLRGKPAEARVYLERILREFPSGVQRTKSALLVARTWFDERNDVNGCATLAQLQSTGIPEGELRMQATDLGRRCTSVNAVNNAATNTAANTAATPPGGTASATKAPVTSAPAPAASTPASDKPTTSTRVPADAKFSVQLAAFDTQREADAAVTRLAKAGVKARVDGSEKPFRVRTGYFATRALANAELARLKKSGQNGFIAELPAQESSR